LDEQTEVRLPKKTRALDHVIGFVSYVLILLPAAGAFYVRAFGINVVFDDAWSIVYLFDKWSSATL
jgi:hypothetical protein